ncbi:MAG: FHIPEP family type III secretion protein, partial [Brucellaceae bacterium]|nr:FHIPEP family type III secretion protein [Brucellaceae bacterium]
QDIPSTPLKEPAFGLDAISVPEAFTDDMKHAGIQYADNMSVLLTHLSEVIRNNLPQLLSFKDVRTLVDQMPPEYRKLADDICTNHISYSGLQAVLKLLLAERVSIRNLNLILEAIAEVAPFMRRSEQIVEHVRQRIAQQLCGDISSDGTLRVLRLGNRWDMVFHQALKKDAKGEVAEFDIDPRLLEEFGTQAKEAIDKHGKGGKSFAIITSPEARPYVRMIVERLNPNLPVLSHVEIAKGMDLQILGAVA